MKTHRIILIGIVYLSAMGVAFGEEYNEPIGESEANRQGKKMSVMVEGGMAISPFTLSGINAGYFLNKDGLIEASYLSGSASLLGTSVESNYVGVGYKHFFGNSFYAHAGIGQREMEVSASDLFTDIEASAKATSIGADIGIGNRWQWDGFTLGCTWLGYFNPLSSSTSKDIPDLAQGTSAANDVDTASGQLGETPNGQLLRLSMGWSF